MKKLLVTSLLGACASLSLLGCSNTQTPVQSGSAGTTSQVEPNSAAGRPTIARQTGAGATQTTNRATGGNAGGG